VILAAAAAVVVHSPRQRPLQLRSQPVVSPSSRSLSVRKSGLSSGLAKTKPRIDMGGQVIKLCTFLHERNNQKGGVNLRQAGKRGFPRASCKNSPPTVKGEV
jgi:hypothetical protein